MDPGQNIASLASLSGYQELNRQDTIKFRDDAFRAAFSVLLQRDCNASETSHAWSTFC